MKATTVMLRGVLLSLAAGTAACGLVEIVHGNSPNQANNPPPLSQARSDTCTSDLAVMRDEAKIPVANPKLCENAYILAQRCSEHPDALEVETAVCAESLAGFTSTASKALQDSTGKSDVGGPLPARIWPELNQSKAPLSGRPLDLGPSIDKQKDFVLAFARLNDLKPRDAKSMAILKNARALREDTIRFERDAERIGTTCESITAFEKKASGVGDMTAARYEALANQVRAARIGEIKAKIQSATSSTYKLEEAKDLGAVRDTVQSTKTLAAQAACMDDGEGQSLVAKVNPWATTLEQALAKESACRTSSKCMSGRVAASRPGGSYVPRGPVYAASEGTGPAQPPPDASSASATDASSSARGPRPDQRHWRDNCNFVCRRAVLDNLSVPDSFECLASTEPQIEGDYWTVVVYYRASSASTVSKLQTQTKCFIQGGSVVKMK